MVGGLKINRGIPEFIMVVLFSKEVQNKKKNAVLSLFLWGDRHPLVEGGGDAAQDSFFGTVP